MLLNLTQLISSAIGPTSPDTDFNSANETGHTDYFWSMIRADKFIKKGQISCEKKVKYQVKKRGTRNQLKRIKKIEIKSSQRESEKESEQERERDRESESETDREGERERKTDRERERERKTDRER